MGLEINARKLQNASDFDNLRVRKISSSKCLQARIIHVSQIFGESCLKARINVWMTSEENKTTDAELFDSHWLAVLHCGSVPNLSIHMLLSFLLVLELSFSLHMSNVFIVRECQYHWQLIY